MLFCPSQSLPTSCRSTSLNEAKHVWLIGLSIDSAESIPDDAQQDVRSFLTQVASHGRNLSLDLDVPSPSKESSTNMRQVIQAIAKKKSLSSSSGPTTRERPGSSVKVADVLVNGDRQGFVNLPKTIYFPYSRHSSYPELCAFVDAFNPRDVWPCTVIPEEWIRNGTSIESLFGRFCSGNTFKFDSSLRTFQPGGIDLLSDKDSQQTYDTQRTTASSPNVPSSPVNKPTIDQAKTGVENLAARGNESQCPLIQYSSPPSNTQYLLPEQPSILGDNKQEQAASVHRRSGNDSSPGESRKRDFDECNDSEMERNLVHENGDPESESQQTEKSFASDISYRDSPFRHDAFSQMRKLARGDEEASIALVSTNAGHTETEKELGS